MSLIRYPASPLPGPLPTASHIVTPAAATGPVDSPALEVSGFGAFAGINPADTINSVTVSVNQFASDALMAAPTFELWDGAAARIGATQTGSGSTLSTNVDTAVITGITYAQLATLRVRITAHSGTAPSGAVMSVDYVSLTVSYTPAVVVAAAGTPQLLVVSPNIPPPVVSTVYLGASQPLGNPAVSTPRPVVVDAPAYTPVPVPPVTITESQPLGNPATGTESALVVGPPFVWCPTPPVKLSSATVLGNPAVGTESALVVTPPPFQPTPTPPVVITTSRPLGNPAVGTGSAIVVTPTPAVAPTPGAKILGPGASAAVVAATTATAQPLVVSTSWQPTVLPVTISSSQPLGNPAVGTDSAIVVTPPTPLVLVPPVNITASQPLGNPAVSTGSPLVVTPPTPLVLVPPVSITASQPLGNPAVGTNAAMVITPPTPIAPVSRALIFGPIAAVAAQSTQPLVVSTLFTANVPGALITASQPLGNPAVGSPQPLVVSSPWISRVPGALISANAAVPIFSTVSTPTALVVGPPFAWCPTPAVSITASRPLGNPATGTPTTVDAMVVTPPFTPVPIPPVNVTASQPLGRPAVGTAVAAQVVTPPYMPVPTPPVIITASQPLGNPAVGTESALVVSPTSNWVPVSPPLVSSPTAVATTPNALVVSPAFTLSPVPGAAVFAIPAPATVSAIRGSVPLVVTPNPGPGLVPKAIVFAPVAVAVTPNALLVTPQFTAVPVPGAQLTASQPLGNPAVGTRSAMVVGPQFAWARVHITKLPLPQQPPSVYTGALDSIMGGSSIDGTGGGISTLDSGSSVTGLIG